MSVAATPEWFPNWHGEVCAIIASGPSVTKADVRRLEGRVRTIAIKRNIDLAPFSDCVYGCDAAWWRNVQGLRDFAGLKVCGTRRGIEGAYPDVRFIDIEGHVDRLILDAPGTIGSGGNSGFQALNLAVAWGATRILLLGFDVGARTASAVHWYGRNSGPGQSNPDEINFRRWRQAFNAASDQLDRLGVVVVNSAVQTSLTCWPRASVAETLAAWC